MMGIIYFFFVILFFEVDQCCITNTDGAKDVTLKLPALLSFKCLGAHLIDKISSLN